MRSLKYLRDPRVYFGPNNQWSKLRAQGCIEDIHCFTDTASPTQMKFCLAVTTGLCGESQGSNGSCRDKISKATQKIFLSQLCPGHEIPVPAPLKGTVRGQPIQAAKQATASKKVAASAKKLATTPRMWRLPPISLLEPSEGEGLKEFLVDALPCWLSTRIDYICDDR